MSIGTTPEVFDVAEAASYLHLRPSYLYQLISKRKIAFCKPTGGRVLFRREDLDAFIDRGRRPADYERSARADQIALQAARR